MEIAANEQKLRAIWEKALHLPADEELIQADTNFFEIGGTSLMIGIMNILCRQSFGKTVPPDFFYEEPTFGRMLKVISNMEG